MTPSNSMDNYLIAGTDDDVVQNYLSFAQIAQTATYELLEQEYVVLDTETTGLSCDDNELIEIAAAIMAGPEVLDTFHTFVNPGRAIPELITELTGIVDADVADAPAPAQAVDMLQEFVGERMLIAHNAKFDYSFVQRYADKDSVLADKSCWIDTLALSRIALPCLKAHDQASMCDAFGIKRGEHRANDDVAALCKLWRIMLAALNAMPHEMLAFLAQMAPDVDWPLRHVIGLIAAESLDKRFSMHFMRDKRIRLKAQGAHLIDPDNGALDLKPVDPQEVEHAFSADGIVGHMYPSFERRDEQVGFALEVSEAFRTSTHRVIEAGTGVGKSISYLLPAVLFAKRNNVRVGIATRTNNLLDQLMFHELPLLRDATNEVMGFDFSYIALKGYDHYPCLRKVMRFARDANEDTSVYDLNTIAALIAAISQSTWCDLDAFSISISNYLKKAVVCSHEDCMHAKCSYYPRRCMLHGARKIANDSQIIVTNHSLLFRDMASSANILPPVRYWVIDEAHGIEEEARAQLSYSISAHDTHEFLRKLGSSQGLIAQIQQLAAGLSGNTTVIAMAAQVQSELTPLSSMSDTFFASVKALGTLGRQSSYAISEIWISEELRESQAWQNLLETGKPMLRQLDDLIRSCRHLSSACKDCDELPEQQAELSSAIGTLEQMLEGISLILDGSNDDYYYYAKVHSNPEKHVEELYAALIDLGGELSDKFYPEVNSVILTSATVAVGESFDYFAHRVGLDRLPVEQWSVSKLQPSDGFYDNMYTLIVSDIPDPRDNIYIDKLANLLLDIHLGLGGGVLTLFTNRREMQRVYDMVNPLLKQAEIELLCQTAGKSKRVLRDEFISKEESCLFATRSFWEGFDAPGRTLRCVVLPKLPFSRPDDPLYQERSTRMNDAWKSYVLPQAIIDTKQAAGRLIRSRNDAGFLVLCDSRLLTKWYGKVFLKSLPQQTMQMVKIEEVRDIMSNSQL